MLASFYAEREESFDGMKWLTSWVVYIGELRG
jgi:hypothetical protein